MKPGWWQSRVCTTSILPRLLNCRNWIHLPELHFTKLDDLRSELLLHQPVDATQNKKCRSTLQCNIPMRAIA